MRQDAVCAESTRLYLPDRTHDERWTGPVAGNPVTIWSDVGVVSVVLACERGASPEALTHPWPGDV